MDFLLDKLILLGFGSVFLFGGFHSVTSVIALLLGITFAALGIYIEDRRFSWLLFAAIFVSCLLCHTLLFFYPIFLYDAIQEKMLPAVLPEAIIFLIFPVFTASEHVMLWILTVILAAFLSLSTSRRRFLSEELIRLRDYSTERSIILEEKNRTLLEKQDYEIHLATLQERNRIAREIHDNVGHMLSRSLLLTGALLTTEKEGSVHEQLKHIKDTLDQAMTSIRKSVHDLHDDSVDLRQSITDAVSPIQKDYQVILDYDMSEDIPSPVKYCLIATVKEAVSNLIRHSNADKIHIQLREHPGLYRLSIEDNGTGASVGNSHGLGLKNMKDRADALHGTLRIHTESGFCIFLSIPKQNRQ